MHGYSRAILNGSDALTIRIIMEKSKAKKSRSKDRARKPHHKSAGSPLVEKKQPTVKKSIIPLVGFAKPHSKMPPAPAANGSARRPPIPLEAEFSNAVPKDIGSVKSQSGVDL